MVEVLASFDDDFKPFNLSFGKDGSLFVSSVSVLDGGVAVVVSEGNVTIMDFPGAQAAVEVLPFVTNVRRVNDLSIVNEVFQGGFFTTNARNEAISQ